MLYIISRHPLLTLALVTRFGLLASIGDGEMAIYRNSNICLIDLEEHMQFDMIPTDIFVDSDRIFVVSFAFGISNERSIGDVVLPNVFLELHPDLRTVEISEENQDSFLGNSLFLTQYHDQKDYDFGKFSLSIGGICVSGDEIVTADDKEFLEKIRIAYEPDTYEANSLLLVRHLQELTKQQEIYSIQGLLTGDRPSDAPAGDIEGFVSENIANITKFFVDNFLEHDGNMYLDIK